jgi:hypothetical protein
MKLAFVFLILLAVVRGQAQTTVVGPGAGVGVGGGMGLRTTGLRGVTYTNLTENTTAQVRNVFFAGGVDLRPTTLNQPAGGPAAATFVRAPVATPPVDGQLKELAAARAQLSTESLRLAAVITEKRQARLSFAPELRQKNEIEIALRQLDRQMAVRAMALKAGRAR